jgi:hypothetical protein
MHERGNLFVFSEISDAFCKSGTRRVGLIWCVSSLLLRHFTPTPKIQFVTPALYSDPKNRHK